MGKRRLTWSLGIVLILAAVIFAAAVLSVRSWARDVRGRQAQQTSASSTR
jgi:uncharacterized protein involved in outer membrane biogenesis